MNSNKLLNTYLLRSNLVRGIDRILSWATCFSSQKSCRLIQPFSHPEVAAFVSRHGFFSSEKPLVGRVTLSEQDIASTAQFLSLISTLISDPKMRDQATGEILAKILAYRELKTGMKINHYTVDQVFDLWHGMPAFGLVSDEAAPLLLFRGTDCNLCNRRAWASIWSDLDMRGPGYSVYQKARPSLRRWLKGKNARAIGCSLGGALAAYAALFDSDLLSNAEPSLAFNPPGVFKKRAKLWHSLNPKPQLITYTTTGDFISKVGYLIGDVCEFSSYRKLRPIEAHVKLIAVEE